jgi:predicted enzyme involved in methoxymalonyl-ACP biosynthesis
MIARAFEQKDADQLREVLQGDVNPKRDIIVVVEIAGKIAGAVAMRPVLYVHDFHLSNGVLKRQVTDCAMAYALGAARAAGNREAIVIVGEENTKMRTWWEEHGAKQQDPGAAYTMEIR